MSTHPMHIIMSTLPALPRQGFMYWFVAIQSKSFNQNLLVFWFFRWNAWCHYHRFYYLLCFNITFSKFWFRNSLETLIASDRLCVVAGVKNDGTFWWPGINSCKPLEGTEHWSGICVFWAPCVCILPWGLVGSLVILENLNRCLNYIILQQIFVWSKKKNPSKFIREFPLLKRKQKNTEIVRSHWYPHPPGSLELCLVF